MGFQGKVEERAKAREMRAQAFTLREIADELGVAKGSVSVWVRDVEFVARPRNRNRRDDAPHPMKLRKQAELEQCRAEAEAFAATLTDRDLLIWGLAMYHGEGAKTEASGFQLANTSPSIIGAFLRWLRSFHDVDESRLRASLYLHEGLDEVTATDRWSALTGIPIEQFTKAYRPAQRGDNKTSKHEFGWLSIRYSDVSLFRRVMALTDAISSAFAIRDSSAGRASDC